MNKELQIAELNSQIKATVGISRIHGIGVIAITSILKDQRVYANQLPKLYNISWGDLRKLFPEIRKIILDRWPSIVNGGKIVAHDVRLLSLMNHSDDPNYDPSTDTAIRNIKIGEEITENYKLMPNYEKVWPDIDGWTSENEKRGQSILERGRSRLKKFLLGSR